MSYSFTLTPEDLVGNLPMVADWSPTLLARFAEGMSLLTSQIVETADIKQLAGVVLVHSRDEHAHAFLVPKDSCVERMRELGVDEEMIAALVEDSGPGMLDIFVLADGHQLVFAAPMMAIPVRPVGGMQ